jgi:hypothetical protein
VDRYVLHVLFFTRRAALAIGGTHCRPNGRTVGADRDESVARTGHHGEDGFSGRYGYATLPAAEMFERLAAQTHRRFIKTHLPVDGVPIFDEVQYIRVARDGRTLSCRGITT